MLASLVKYVAHRPPWSCSTSSRPASNWAVRTTSWTGAAEQAHTDWPATRGNLPVQLQVQRAGVAADEAFASRAAHCAGRRRATVPRKPTHARIGITRLLPMPRCRLAGCAPYRSRQPARWSALAMGTAYCSHQMKTVKGWATSNDGGTAWLKLPFVALSGPTSTPPSRLRRFAPGTR